MKQESAETLQRYTCTIRNRRDKWHETRIINMYTRWSATHAHAHTLTHMTYTHREINAAWPVMHCPSHSDEVWHQQQQQPGQSMRNYVYIDMRTHACVSVGVCSRVCVHIIYTTENVVSNWFWYFLWLNSPKLKSQPWKLICNLIIALVFVFGGRDHWRDGWIDGDGEMVREAVAIMFIQWLSQRAGTGPILLSVCRTVSMNRSSTECRRIRKGGICGWHTRSEWRVGTQSISVLAYECVCISVTDMPVDNAARHIPLQQLIQLDMKQRTDNFTKLFA